MSASSSPARRLALHPSALSDAEHALFTASLADLADTTGDLEHVSVSVREARAWLCGRYAALGSGTVDAILRLFAPATTLSSGAFFAAQRLVVHAQVGRGVDRGLAFVQGVARPRHTDPGPHQPLPPHARPSPKPAPARPCPAQTDLAGVQHPTQNRRHLVLRVLLTTSASSLVRAAPKDTPRALPLALPRRLPDPPAVLPPTHPLRRASTQLAPASSPPHIQHFADSTMQRTPSAGGAPRTRPQNQAQPPAQAQVHAHAQNPAQNQNPFRPAPPPRRASLSVPTSPEPPAPPFLARGAYPTSAGPRTTSFAPHPPVHPQRRASAFEAAYGADAGALSPPASPAARRVSSDSARSSTANSGFARERTASTGVLPLTLPKALRRTLAGAGWVGAERGEREGLVRGGGGGYTVRNGRRGAEDVDGGGEGEAWGAL
ncbi:hypothetical protein B0H17DRAFT_1337340 [Mycena rosella]|uniref:Uncharacterized protein n=1 Tax=Mycena rosella TaxID=1033263 RepID=A0AAD7G646_MYCRO|nr:hypothetical protein B0H17DRAFT_1337340 [Mycena rosella]